MSSFLPHVLLALLLLHHHPSWKSLSIIPFAHNHIHTQSAIHIHTTYLRSTSSTCIAAYARTTNAAANTPNPTTSLHSACVSNPNVLRIAEPGTSISMPYLWSIKLRYLTSLTMMPSNA